MNVQELIAQLQTMPQDLPVYVSADGGLEDVEAWTGIIGDPLDDELDCVIIGPKAEE